MRVIAICNNKWFDKEDWNKLNEIQKSLEGNLQMASDVQKINAFILGGGSIGFLWYF